MWKPVELDAELSNNEWWLFAQMERVAGMVKRDKNHPSIIFWSLGNESGVGANNAARASWVKDYDPTRLVHFEAICIMEVQDNMVMASIL